MGTSKNFALKLRLALTALNITRGRLAVALAVDKSLVGRWVSGTVTPSAHNLAKLTALLAEYQPAFSPLDWERELPGFADLFGVDPAMAEQWIGRDHAPAAAHVLPPSTLEIAQKATLQRGASYEGLWRVTQPAFTDPGRLVHPHCLISRRDNLLQIKWGAPGWLCTGALLIVMGQLFGILTDEADDTILFCVLNGVSMPRVTMLDGLMLTNAKDGSQTPTAAACVLERVADLSGDLQADTERYEQLRQSVEALRADDVSDDIRAHILRDVGPGPFGGGGDLLLRAPLARSLSRGTPRDSW